jgi:hypothetical protein
MSVVRRWSIQHTVRTRNSLFNCSQCCTASRLVKAVYSHSLLEACPLRPVNYSQAGEGALLQSTCNHNVGKSAVQFHSLLLPIRSFTGFLILHQILVDICRLLVAPFKQVKLKQRWKRGYPLAKDHKGFKILMASLRKNASDDEGSESDSDFSDILEDVRFMQIDHAKLTNICDMQTYLFRCRRQAYTAYLMLAG